MASTVSKASMGYNPNCTRIAPEKATLTSLKMSFYALGFQGVSGWLEPYIKGVLFKIEN